jgi:K+-sensing histidine kinase KdpD
MVDPSSESVKDKVQSNQGVVQWAIQGVKVGAIAALIQVLIVGAFGGILFDMMQDSEVFKVLLLFFLAIILLACLGGIIAGFVSSRLGTKERKFGATVVYWLYILFNFCK